MSHNPFTLKQAVRPHLVRTGGGLSGEVADLRTDVKAALDTMEAQGGYFRTDEFTDPAGASANAFKTSFATTAAIQTFTGAALNGATGLSELKPPRNATITSTANAAVTAVAVVITGQIRNADGVLVTQTDTITTTAGGGVTDAGAKPFSKITSVVIPAMGGAGGSLQIGFGAMIGLSAKIKSRAGLIRPLREVSAGSVVTNGTFANPTGSPVTSYTPNTAPNGTADYAVTYEVDPV